MKGKQACVWPVMIRVHLCPGLVKLFDYHNEQLPIVYHWE